MEPKGNGKRGRVGKRQAQEEGVWARSESTAHVGKGMDCGKRWPLKGELQGWLWTHTDPSSSPAMQPQASRKLSKLHSPPQKDGHTSPIGLSVMIYDEVSRTMPTAQGCSRKPLFFLAHPHSGAPAGRTEKAEQESNVITIWHFPSHGTLFSACPTAASSDRCKHS